MLLPVLRRGLAAALGRPTLALRLYLANLILAALPTAMVGFAIWLVGGERPWATALVGDDWLNLVVEIVAATGAAGLEGAERRLSAAAVAALAFPLGVLALLLQALTYALLSGGILERLRDDGRGPSFWAACRYWFWPFVRLGLLGTSLVVGLGLAALAGSGVLEPALGSGITLIIWAAWLSALNGWLELARAGMVVQGQRRAASALVRALRLALRPRHLPPLLGMWLIFAIVGLGLFAAQVLIPAEPVAAAIAGQILLFAGAWLKVVRLATALAFEEALGRGTVPSPSGRGLG